ncbi:hypothetical protein QQF64_028732 [Cirrhinus molitorella]|uniref:Uncharacterized protein n=1 Tax=Cirrhinus molitorella TaxID=172907 RepID=A0ABR3N7H4_9TELE
MCARSTLAYRWVNKPRMSPTESQSTSALRPESMLLINYIVMMEKRSGVAEGERVHLGGHACSYLIHLKAGNDSTLPLWIHREKWRHLWNPARQQEAIQ